MDIEKLYQSIFLRDILEYFTPGSVIAFSVCLLTESILYALGINFSMFSAIASSGFLGISIALAISYALGHLLTGADYIKFREREISQASDMLSKDSWLRLKIVRIISDYMEIPEPEVDIIFKDPKSATIVREIVRSLIFDRNQELYRDFVNRHSILSRFCKNMAHALSILLLSVIISAAVVWNEVLLLYQKSPIVVILAGVIIVGLIYVAIRIFIDRSRRLRDIMIKHTFQILYADFIESKLDPKKTDGANAQTQP